MLSNRGEKQGQGWVCKRDKKVERMLFGKREERGDEFDVERTAENKRRINECESRFAKRVERLRSKIL